VVDLVLIPQQPDRYLRSPRLALGGEPRDRIELHLLAWGGLTRDDDEHLVFPLALDDTFHIGESARITSGTDLLDLLNSDRPRITRDPLDEDRAFCDAESVEIERALGGSRVILVRGTSRVMVWEAQGTAAAPALAVTADGTWVAFHHNVREDTGEPDLTKWIAVFFVDAHGAVHAPSAPMTDRDRDRAGEEQGFEFPSLALGPDGALGLFGRGSHSFWRQDLSAMGFGPRVALGDGDWGCRGRRVSPLVMGDRVMGYRVLTARRERKGIVLETSDAPSGGRADLRPTAPLASTTTAISTAARVRLRPRASDPAAHWKRHTLFGDIHQHSAHSDGCGTAHEPYLRARHQYGDDFCALSDHESFLGKRIGPSEWRYLEAVAEAHHRPGAPGQGSFSTLFAYEWTGRAYPGPGHKVVYSEHPGSDIVSRDREPTGEGLISRLRVSGAIAVPHHVGWTGADEAAHDPEVQPIWEICSCHGCYLTADHPLGGRGDLRDQMVDAVLRRGARFGFIACSDGHGLLFHHGVGRKRDPFRTGLTAVQVEHNDRRHILGALRERRSYATSGVPIYLDVDAEGAPMGSVVKAGSRVSIRAAGCAPIRKLSLVGPDGVIAEIDGSGIEAEIETKLDAAWAYAKVEQLDGEMAWSSPLWIER